MKKWIFWSLFILILILAAAPRVIELLAHNYLFGFDQGWYYQEVKKIVVDHKLTLIGIEVGGNGGFFQGPGWLYLLTIPFFLTNGDPYGGMVVMFLLSLGVVALAMWWLSREYDKTTGLVVGLILAICPALVSQARFIWSPFPISILTVFILYCLYKVFNGQSKYLTGAAAGLSAIYHFEVATFGTWLIASIPVIIYLIAKKLIKIKDILLSVLVALIFISPIVIFDLRHNFLISKGLSHIMSGNNPEHQATWLFTKIMYLNHWAIFRGSLDSAFVWAPKFTPLAYLILLGGSLVYLLDKKIKLSQKRFLGYLVVAPYLLFAVFLLYRWPMWEWWILQLIIINCFLLGILLSYFAHKFKVARVMVSLVLILFVGIYVKKTINFYRVDYPDYGGTHKLKGIIDALDVIYQDAKGKPFNLLVFSPPIYTYPYDYLVWWYGSRKYGYLPGDKKEGTFYLLMEPDPSKPYSYNGWLETVIKTGKVIQTTNLHSGFIIQKRQAL